VTALNTVFQGWLVPVLTGLVCVDRSVVILPEQMKFTDFLYIEH
jgi:hypothetical protein